MTKIIPILIFFLALLFLTITACHRKIPVEEFRKHIAAQTNNAKLLLKSIKGIRYTEVKRVFDNGVSFSPQGYQLVPSWRMSFPSADSVYIFNSTRNIFNNAPLIFDHDSIFNIAWAYLRLQKLTKDSLKFEVLKVKDRVIIDQKTNVFMTFYSDEYIHYVLHTDTNKLRRPTQRDTLYIKTMTAEARSNPDSAFAATQPVIFKSNSPLLTVSKEEITPDELNNVITEDRYLSPEYNITIKKAYDNFSYLFTVWVDEKGHLTFRKSLIPMMPESMLTAMNGIVNGYLKLYLKTAPGETLGIPHASVVILHVKGIK
jgi:hypothetical protein